MDNTSTAVSRMTSALLGRRKVLKLAGGAAALMANGRAVRAQEGTAPATPNAGTAPAGPEALSTGGTVPGPPGYELPMVEPGSTTFAFATFDNWYAARSYTQNLEVWAEIENRTGVAIEWDVAPAAQYHQSMPARVGAGTDLPDMLALPTGWDAARAGAEGIAIPLSDYISEENTPNIVRYLDEFPDIEQLMTAPDGNIYALPSVVTDAGFSDPFGLIIRRDWLTKLNLEEPKTLDDWYTVLKAFKTQDPNGNGQQDEVPLVIAGHGAGILNVFGVALGLHWPYSDGRYVDESGKVSSEWTDSRTKELLTWLNKLYAEGLIDPQFYQTDHAAALQKVTRDLAGAGVDFSNRAIEYNRAQANAGQTEATWVTVVPPTSDRIETPYYEMYGPLSGEFSITKDCADPQLAAKWLDYIWASDEGNTLVTYGIEGLTYEVDENGELRLTEWVTDNPEGLDPNSALRYYGAQPNTPWIRAERGPLSELAWDITRTDPLWVENASKVAPYMVAAYPPILPTAEESDELASIEADLYTYRDETVLQFVLGQQPINDETWAEYVATLESLGLGRTVEIRQQMYDRFRGVS